MSHEHPETDPGAVCRSCGLCCDGGFFSHANLKDSDPVEELAALGLRSEEQDGKRRFVLPCAAHKDGVCSIYYDHERAAVCRSYECKLLRRHRAGKVGLSDALECVARMRRLVDDIRRRLTEVGANDDTKSLSQCFRDFMTQHEADADTPEFRRRYGDLMVKMRLMKQLYERDFRRPKDKKAAEGKAMMGEGKNDEPAGAQGQ